MDFLLNMNFVYLALVLGFLLALLAVIVPGTGLIEILAFVSLLYAGYGIYYFAERINLLAFLILFAGFIPFVIAAIRKTGQVAYLVFSILAMVVGSAFLFRGERLWLPAVDPFLVIVVSLLNAGFLWVVIRKSMEATLALPAQDPARIIGVVGEAATDINDEGTVQVASELWSARSNVPISAGQDVRVVSMDGFILEVEPADKPSENHPQDTQAVEDTKSPKLD